MAVRIIREETTQELGKIVQSDADFVSLVRHGANRQAFRVVKNDTGGNSMPVVVQSLLLPSGMTLDALVQEAGMEWLKDIKADVVHNRGTHQELVQKDRSAFDEGSLTFKKLGKTDALVVVGAMKDASTPHDKADALALPADPSSIPITSQERSPIAMSFSDLFFSELDGFIDVVQGTMKSTQMEPAARKSTILAAHKAFGTFLAMSLDALGSVLQEQDKTKFDMEASLQQLRDSVSRILSPPGVVGGNTSPDGIGGLEEMFKSKEEMAEFISNAMAAKLDEYGIKKPEPVTPPHPDVEALKDTIKTLTDGLTALTEKVDKIKVESTPTPASADAGDDTAGMVPKTKSDDVTTDVTQDPKAKPELFKGLLFNWAGIEKSLQQS